MNKILSFYTIVDGYVNNKRFLAHEWLTGRLLKRIKANELLITACIH